MHDLIIIGAGPAGLTSALYAGRYRLDTILIEKMAPGGQIILSSSIDNFPGFPSGIATQELIEKFVKQTEEVGIKMVNSQISEITLSAESKDYFFSAKGTDQVYQSKCVIIATGASPRQLGAEGENKFIGRGVSYCATCDGPLFKNKDVMVVGGGDRAVEEAIFLSSYANTVYLLHRRTELRASKILVEKALGIPKIKFILESVVEKISGRDKLERIMIRNVSTSAQAEVACQGIFIFVGIRPNTGFLKNLLAIDDGGFIITQHDMRSSIEGIFACGDCCKKSLYQVVTACSEGAIAADSVHKYLLNK